MIAISPTRKAEADGDCRLDETKRKELVSRLMSDRRVVLDVKQSADLEAEVAAQKAIDDFNRTLSERGPVWWKDGSPDLDRHIVKNTPCAAWYAKIGPACLGGT